MAGSALRDCGRPECRLCGYRRPHHSISPQEARPRPRWALARTVHGALLGGALWLAIFGGSAVLIDLLTR